MEHQHDMPQGFGMALARNLEAMNNFTTLPLQQQLKIIDHSRTLHSKEEMTRLVEQIGDGKIFI